MSKQKDPKEVPQEILIQSIIDNLDGNNKRFAFLLGAGASVTSGIPAAAELAKKWLKQLKDIDPKEYKALNQKTDLAASYSTIYYKRFFHQQEDGDSEIEKIMSDDKVAPSLGYVMLMSFLLETDNNVIITTNFDRLSETALLTVFNQHAKVIYHEYMLQFITVGKKKPTIIKIHNDAFFRPKSDGKDTAKLSNRWKKIVKSILKDYYLIVLGYGGNDKEGLMKYIVKIADSDRIYWCYRKEEDIPQTITDEKFRRVNIKGFDEFMLALNQRLPEDKISKLEKIQNMIKKTANERIKDLDENINKINKSSEDRDSSLKFLENFTANTWWDYQLQINKSKTENEKDRLYRQGLEKFSKSPELTGNYAVFLYNIRKDYDTAEQYYKKALELEPDHANNNGNYAYFLYNIRKAYDTAEQYYKKALKLEPDHTNNNGNYAIFLYNIRKDYDTAEQYYKKALELEPDNANNNVNYAILLSDTYKDYGTAEQYYKKALELEPDNANNNGNYATFLYNIRKAYDKAEQYYKKALELEPDHTDNNENYATFLGNIRKDYDKAEQYYKKALELEPDHANNNGNYAIFLYNIRKDYNNAEQYYKKALKLEPDHANNNGNYATFLSDIRKDYDKAEQYFKKALELEPDHANTNGSYALFLCNIRKAYDKAEQYYKKALELEPDHANNNENYAIFLDNIRKAYDKAEQYYKKST